MLLLVQSAFHICVCINHCLNLDFSSILFLTRRQKKRTKLDYSFWREINRQKRKVISKRFFPSRLQKEMKNIQQRANFIICILFSFEHMAFVNRAADAAAAASAALAVQRWMWMIWAGKFAGRLNFNRLMAFTDLIGHQMTLSFIKTN